MRAIIAKVCLLHSLSQTTEVATNLMTTAATRQMSCGRSYVIFTKYFSKKQAASKRHAVACSKRNLSEQNCSGPMITINALDFFCFFRKSGRAATE